MAESGAFICLPGRAIMTSAAFIGCDWMNGQRTMLQGSFTAISSAKEYAPAMRMRTR
jgi:hypothetical protein